MGTGALGPLGSAQTVLLAIVNVAMQPLVQVSVDLNERHTLKSTSFDQFT